MTNAKAKWNKPLKTLLTALLLCGVCLAFLTTAAPRAFAAKGPADGQHTAEMTFVSKDKEDLKFLYLSGLVLNTNVPGVSYDKSTNTLTLENVNLSSDDKHYSLTITNMGENFSLNIVGKNALDYLSLDSVGYDTGCNITGYGTLDIGYLDLSTDGSKLNVTVDNTVNFHVNSKQMGFETLPAVKITSKQQLTEIESIIKILGNTKDDLVYEEDNSGTSYTYETATNQLTVTPTTLVRKGTDGKWGYYKGDVLQSSFNGLAGNQNGLWKIENGLVNFKYLGLVEGNNGWYMVINGKVDETFNGLASNEYGHWFVEKGKVQFGYVGPVIINGQKYNIDKGKVIHE